LIKATLTNSETFTLIVTTQPVPKINACSGYKQAKIGIALILIFGFINALIQRVNNKFSCPA
jgi:hypothetical protein